MPKSCYIKVKFYCLAFKREKLAGPKDHINRYYNNVLMCIHNLTTLSVGKRSSDLAPLLSNAMVTKCQYLVKLGSNAFVLVEIRI